MVRSLADRTFQLRPQARGEVQPPGPPHGRAGDGEVHEGRGAPSGFFARCCRSLVGSFSAVSKPTFTSRIFWLQNLAGSKGMQAGKPKNDPHNSRRVRNCPDEQPRSRWELYRHACKFEKKVEFAGDSVDGRRADARKAVSLAVHSPERGPGKGR